MKLSEIDVNDLLCQNFIDEYKKGISMFFSELVTLNTNIFILRKIEQFPFSLFCKPSNTIFFSTIQQNLYDMSIVIITKTFTDKGGDLITLPKFKNSVLKNTDSKYRDELKKKFKEQRFDTIVTDLIEKATSIRNSRVAHLKSEAIFSGKIELLRIEELEKIAEELNILVQSISFNVERVYLPLFYTEYYKEPTDVEKLLDSLARESTILNLPETFPIGWKRQKTKMSEEQLKMINIYRQKFGLPLV